MALEKLTVVDSIEVKENGCVQVRKATRIVENDTIISESFHRHVVAPGDDFSNEDPRVKAICATVHTADVVSAYAALRLVVE